MLRYRYRASTVDGQVVEGTLQAPSERSALEDLRRQRLYPVDLTRVGDAGRGDRAARTRSLGRTPALAVFTRTVATMTGAGGTLDRAVAFAAEQTRNADVARAARDVHLRLQSGDSLATAVSQHPGVFSPLYVAMVAAGEESGALPESLARLASHLDETVELQGQVRAALLYPALMGIVAGAGVTILLLFVVPRFAGIVEASGGALPLSTRVLVGASAILVNGWWLLLLAGVGLILAARSWLGRPENVRRWHAWRLRQPLVGELELKVATAAFARALGMLLKSGRAALPSLRAAQASASNLELRAQLEDAAEAVSHGKRVHVALAGTLPAMAAELLAVGEESGRLDEMCLRVAEAYDSEVRRSVRALVAVIEPILILVFGVIVGFVALAMLQAIYGINVSAL
jgi:type II secretory pathway component PulF